MALSTTGCGTVPHSQYPPPVETCQYDRAISSYYGCAPTEGLMLTHDYTVICEHARMEFGGKWTIIGLFPNGIGTPQIPFPLPVLTFFQAFHSDKAQQYRFTAKLSQLDNGAVLASANGGVHTAQAGPVIVPLALGNIQFKAFGLYSWSIEVEGQDEPFLTQFNVAHVPQPMMIMPPAPRP